MSAVVEPETGELTVLMSKDEALAATAKIKSCMGVLCQLVKEAHDKQAWRALGYGSWAAYCKAEFDYSRSYSYRLIGHVNKILELSAAAGIEAEVSPMGDTLTERATRDLNTSDAVEAVRDAVADLPADASDQARSDAATAGIAKMRERHAAEAATREPELDPVGCSVTDCPDNANSDDGMCSWHRGKHAADAAAKTSDTGPSHPPVSDAPDVDPPASGATTPGKAGADAPSDAAATGTTERSGQTAPLTDGEDGGTASSSAAVPPSLPDDWRKRIADAAYLLGCPAEAMRDAINDDDRWDLTALRDHLNTILQEQS